MLKLEQYKLKRPHPKLQNKGNVLTWHFVFVEVLPFVATSETRAFAWQSNPAKEYTLLLALTYLNNCCSISRANKLSCAFRVCVCTAKSVIHGMNLSFTRYQTCFKHSHSELNYSLQEGARMWWSFLGWTGRQTMQDAYSYAAVERFPPRAGALLPSENRALHRDKERLRSLSESVLCGSELSA